MSFGPPSKFNGVPVYHRPISSQGLRAPFATDALPTAAMQTAHFVTDGRGHFQASRSLSQTQPIIAKPIRGTSAVRRTSRHAGGMGREGEQGACTRRMAMRDDSHLHSHFSSSLSLDFRAVTVRYHMLPWVPRLRALN